MKTSSTYLSYLAATFDLGSCGKYVSDLAVAKVIDRTMLTDTSAVVAKKILS